MASALQLPSISMVQSSSPAGWVPWARWRPPGCAAQAHSQTYGCWAARGVQVSHTLACRGRGSTAASPSFADLAFLSCLAGGETLAQLVHSVRQVTCAKADVSAAEEAAHALTSAGWGSQPLHGILHAGGVLDSKVVTNVNATTIRTEFAGACCHQHSFEAWSCWPYPRGVFLFTGVSCNFRDGPFNFCEPAVSSSYINQSPCYRQGIWRPAPAVRMHDFTAGGAASIFLPGRV